MIPIYSLQGVTCPVKKLTLPEKKAQKSDFVAVTKLIPGNFFLPQPDSFGLTTHAMNAHRPSSATFRTQTALLCLFVMNMKAAAAPFHMPSRSVLIADEVLIPVPQRGVMRYHLMKVLQIPENEVFFIPTAPATQEWEEFETWQTADPQARLELNSRQLIASRQRYAQFCDDRGYLRYEHFARALCEHQIDVRRMVGEIYRFGYSMDAQSPIFNRNVPPGIERDLAGIMELDSGRSAFAVVAPHDPSVILATVSTAHADRNGKVPLESRLKIDGKPYTLPPVTDEYYQDSSRHPYVYWRNPTRSFPLAEDVFNAYPVTVRKNLRVEIKLYAKDPRDSTPWGVMLARQALAHNLTRRTNELVPSEFMPKESELGQVLEIYVNAEKQIADEDIEYQMALRDALFQVIHSQWVRRYVWPEEVVIQEVGPQAKKLYSLFFGIKDHYPTTPDPDVTGSMVTVGRASRKDFDQVLASQALLNRGAPLMDTFFQRLFQTSPFRDSQCSFLLHAMAVEFPFAGSDRQNRKWFEQKMSELYAKGVF